MEQIIAALAPVLAEARRSFTFDRGTEFMAWRRLLDGLGAQTWFCDPSSPWQKGSDENTNRRLRRYLPRETDLIGIREKDLRDICQTLDSTSRKCLGYRTPAEAFSINLRGIWRWNSVSQLPSHVGWNPPSASHVNAAEGRTPALKPPLRVSLAKTLLRRPWHR